MLLAALAGCTASVQSVDEVFALTGFSSRASGEAARVVFFSYIAAKRGRRGKRGLVSWGGLCYNAQLDKEETSAPD